VRRSVRAAIGVTAAAAALAPGCGAGSGAPAGRQAGAARVCSTIAPPGAFRPDPGLFASKRPPGPGDWLTLHPEHGQSFEDYVRARPARPNAARDVIVLQPIGPFAPDEAELLETLRDYLTAFYQLETRIAEPLPLPLLGMRARDMDGETIVQYRADLIENALKPRLPPDAVAYLGITTSGLFADWAWEFVFGLASLDRRVGVFSLARYGAHVNGEPDTPAARRLTLRRAMMVMAHETGHMFSLPHCAAYECLMNGAGSLEELDRGTPWLCPDCLRKLYFSIGFDFSKRYAELRAFHVARGMHDNVDWIDRRIAHLER
jgi:archaemetzincin